MKRVLDSAACGSLGGHGRPTVLMLPRKRRHQSTRYPVVSPGCADRRPRTRQNCRSVRQDCCMSESGWVSWSPGGDNERLPSELRARVQRECEEERATRGRQVARVVVDVFESGQVVPYLQLPAGSPIDPGDRHATAAAVRKASDALAGWQ